MTRWLAVAACTLGLPLAAGAASAYLEVGVAAAVLVDAPSARAARLFIVTEATPLEVLSTLPPWTKVRDVDGSVSWIRTGELRAATHVLATSVATVRAAPAESAQVRFQVARGVLLERIGDDDHGWVEVRHEGTVGYVRVDEVWGL